MSSILSIHVRRYFDISPWVNNAEAWMVDVGSIITWIFNVDCVEHCWCFDDNMDRILNFLTKIWIEFWIFWRLEPCFIRKFCFRRIFEPCVLLKSLSHVFRSCDQQWRRNPGRVSHIPLWGVPLPWRSVHASRHSNLSQVGALLATLLGQLSVYGL